MKASRNQTLIVAIILVVTLIAAVVILKTPAVMPAGESGHGSDTHAEHDEEKGHAAGAARHDEHAGEEKESGASKADTHAEHEAHGGDHVEMDEAKLKAAKITLVKAGPTELTGETLLPGEIQLNEDRQSHVTPRLAGVAVQVVKSAGATVKKGDVLAIIESQELAELRSRYLVAAKRVDLAKSTYEREKKLWEGKISPEQDYLTAKNDLAEARIEQRALGERIQALGASAQAGGLARYELRAPHGGVVIEKHVTAGEAVQADSDLFRIADLSTVWAEITVNPKNLGQVRVGQPVRIMSPDLNMEVNGTVSYVGSLIGEQTRTAKARVTLPNPDSLWRPGLFVSVAVAEGRVTVPVAIPASAIQSLEDREVVFVREGDAFEARTVKLGRKSDHMVEVIEGLKPNETVAAENSFIIKADIGKASAEHEH